MGGDKKHRKKRHRDSSSSSDECDHLDLLNLVVRKPHRHRRLDRRLKKLADACSTVNRLDSQGQTLLHKAALCGHADVARVLLSHGADLRVQDRSGNTPAHLAALKGHLVLLAQLLQGIDPPDIDQCFNDASQSIADLSRAAMEKLEERDLMQSQQFQGSETDEEAEKDPEKVWRQKLHQECSDEEQQDWGCDDDFSGWNGRGQSSVCVETDDAWASRLWSEMQARRRAAAQAQASAFFGSRRNQQEAEDAAAAAAAARQRESERVLHREREKDSEWRRRVAGDGGVGSGPRIGPQPPPSSWIPAPALDHGALRTQYERKWKALEDRDKTGSQPVGFEDIPWPLLGSGTTIGDCVSGGDEDLAEVMLWGTSGPAEVKARLRMEIMRWHSDKFVSRWGSLLDPSQRPRVLQGVQAVSQHLTRLMGVHRL